MGGIERRAITENWTTVWGEESVPMNYLQNLIELEGMMFLMIALGILSIRTGILSKKGRDELTDLILYIIFPCYIVDCFIQNIGAFSSGGFVAVAITSLVLQGGTILLSQLLYRKEAPGRRTILQYATIVSNSGFLGFPLVGSIFGAQGLIYASIFLIFQRINNFSVAISYFTSSEKKGVLRRTLSHPCILSTLIGVAIMLLEWHPPVLLENTLSSIGACSTPLSMMLIGMVLADAGRGKYLDGTTACYSVLRLFLIPAGIFALCKLLRYDSLVTGTSVLLAGMPAGTLSVMLGAKYGKDAAFASRLVIFTTAISLLTIPLWCLACIYL